MLAGLGLRGEALPRLRAGGAVAVVFVPRWVRAALLLDPAAPEVRVAVVSLPRATNLRLQPHDDDFAEALGECADPRFALTRLVNRGYVATGRGDVLQLDLSLQDQERRFKVDVVAVKGDTGVRCGTARPPPAVVPGAAPAAEEEVRAACAWSTRTSRSSFCRRRRPRRGRVGRRRRRRRRSAPSRRRRRRPRSPRHKRRPLPHPRRRTCARRGSGDFSR